MIYCQSKSHNHRLSNTMQLNDFLIKNSIKLNKDVLDLCNEGMEIMKLGTDKMHDAAHIYRVLDILDKFLHAEKEKIIHSINFNVLMVSICWHDTWRALRKPQTKVSVLLDEIWDGMGSVGLIKEKIKHLHVSLEEKREMIRCIRHHGTFNIARSRSVESKILKDLDLLEVWSFERFEALKQEYLFVDIVNPITLRAAKFYFDRFMKKQDGSKYYFEFFKQEFLKTKADYIANVDKLLEDYGHYLKRKK